MRKSPIICFVLLLAGLLAGCGEKQTAPAASASTLWAENRDQCPEERNNQAVSSDSEKPAEEKEPRLLCQTNYNGNELVCGTVTYYYSEEGLLLRWESVESQETDVGSRCTEEYVYDGQGNMICRTTSEQNGDGEVYLLSQARYDYDTQGRLIHYESVWGAKPYEEETYSYDEHGQLQSKQIVHYQIGDPGWTDETITYLYDENGRVIREDSCWVRNVDSEHAGSWDMDNGPINSTTGYAYDRQGRLIRKERSNHNGVVKEDSYTCFYDGQENLARRAYDDGDTETWMYDGQGRILRTTGRHYGDDGTNQDIYEYTYSPDGGYGRLYSTAAAGLQCEEQYDPQGNLTERIYYNRERERMDRWVYTYG